MICSLPDCGKPHYARGLCEQHYQAAKGRGQLENLPRFRSRRGGGSRFLTAGGYRVAGPEGKPMYEHRMIGERVLGKPLPPGAEMHHVDGNRLNNANNNLVICESATYHRLLHSRMEALKATGDPAKRRCVRCFQWDHVANMTHHGQNERFKHRGCEAAYRRQLNKSRSSTEG